MSQLGKLLKKFLTIDKNIRFEEVKKVLEHLGYTISVPKSGSSHYTFRKKGCTPITIPKHTPIKETYIKEIKRIIESEENSQ